MPSFLSPIDLNRLELKQFKLHNAAGNPYTASFAGKGGIYMDTSSNRPLWSDGSGWNDIWPAATANTANTVVLRDGFGNFTAGTITASISGTASLATALATSRNFSITGKATAASIGFDGTGAVALNVTALAVAVGDISLASGSFIVGSGSVGSAVAKSAIPISGFGSAAVDVDMGGKKLVSVGDPAGPQDAATKAYVDSVTQGLDIKASCNWASNAALPSSTYSSVPKTITATANGALTIDGSAMAGGNVGNRILVKNQATATQNGIYTLTQAGDAGSPFILTRATDFDTSAKITTGAFVFIEQGTANANTGWVLTTAPTITLDATNLTFAQFSGAGTYSAGNGMVLSGGVFHFSQSGAYTVGDMHYATSGSNIGTLSAAGVGNALISGGSATAPSWGKIGLTSHVSGTLPIGSGGTNATTITPNGVAYGGSSAYAFTSVGTPAQILMANASNVPTFTTITGDVTTSSLGVTTIGANKVLYSMIQGIAALSVMGNTGSSSATPGSISGTANQVLVVNAAGTSLGFSTVNLASSSAVGGVLPIANGGTGLSSVGASGTTLVSNGATASWTTLSLTAGISGILPSTNGGTGVAYFGVSGPTALRTYSFTDRSANIAAQVTSTFTGNNSSTQFSANHNLGSKNVIAQLYDTANDNVVFTDTKALDTNNVQFTFAVAPSNTTVYRWVVIGF